MPRALYSRFIDLAHTTFQICDFNIKAHWRKMKTESLCLSKKSFRSNFWFCDLPNLTQRTQDLLWLILLVLSPFADLHVFWFCSSFQQENFQYVNNYILAGFNFVLSQKTKKNPGLILWLGCC